MADDNLAGFRKLVDQTAAGQDPKTESVSSQVDKLIKIEQGSVTDYTRLLPALAIMLVYFGSIAVALIWFGVELSKVPAGGPRPTTLDPYAVAMLDILKVLVLPVVTLMLGFYFGTGSASRAPATHAATTTTAR